MAGRADSRVGVGNSGPEVQSTEGLEALKLIRNPVSSCLRRARRAKSAREEGWGHRPVLHREGTCPARAGMSEDCPAVTVALWGIYKGGVGLTAPPPHFL